MRGSLIVGAIRLLLPGCLFAASPSWATPFVLVSNKTTGSVLQVDATTGEFLGTFASHPDISNTQNLTIISG